MIYKAINSLIEYGIKENLISLNDKVYIKNKIYNLLKLEGSNNTDSLATIKDALEVINEYAFNKKLIKYNSVHYLDNFEAKIMDILIDKPSNIINMFNDLYNIDIKQATDYFYDLAKKSNYIKVDRINKNIHYSNNTKYGEIEITINLSKPEKDPNQIKAALNEKQIGYPKCVLCRENEGFMGNDKLQARDTLRLLPIVLNNENWFMQYSPYVYYNEHCIVLSENHYPMKTKRESFIRLIDFVDYLPHYFLGSNAGLPIVGGSILNHDHYQGGNHNFPIYKAKSLKAYTNSKYPNCEISILDWPVSVIKVSSDKRDELIDLVSLINLKWENYTNERLNIFSHTDDILHNAVTPICRKENNKYVFYIALRNNKTDLKYPDGIFHVKPDKYNIKKENIGLIEVMGLAILPGRLNEEIKEIKNYLEGKNDVDENLFGKHRIFAQDIKEKYNNLKDLNLDLLIKNEIINKFVEALEDTSVFKENIDEFDDFIKNI